MAPRLDFLAYFSGSRAQLPSSVRAACPRSERRKIGAPDHSICGSVPFFFLNPRRRRRHFRLMAALLQPLACRSVGSESRQLDADAVSPLFSMSSQEHTARSLMVSPAPRLTSSRRQIELTFHLSSHSPSSCITTVCGRVWSDQVKCSSTSSTRRIHQSRLNSFMYKLQRSGVCAKRGEDASHRGESSAVRSWKSILRLHSVVADSDPRRNQFICAARSGRLSHDHDSRNLYRHPQQPKPSSQLFVITRELERKLAFPATDWY